MRLTVAAIGRLRDGPERELAERYRKRAEQLGRRIGLRDVEIVEVRESRAQEVGKRMIEESIAIANVIPDKAAIVILDERGESLDSAALAHSSANGATPGRPAAVFIIGGDDGLAPGAARTGDAAACFRRRDLAASAGAGHAARTDLPRDHHPGRASLPPRLENDRSVAWTRRVRRVTSSADGAAWDGTPIRIARWPLAGAAPAVSTLAHRAPRPIDARQAAPARQGAGGGPHAAAADRRDRGTAQARDRRASATTAASSTRR